MKYFDAHCHILSDEQMHNAAARGVDGFVVNAAQMSGWRAVVEMAHRDDVYGAIGAHPWYVAELSDGWDDELVKTLAENTDLMVGEIGLDKNYPNFDAQVSVFKRQLQIAHDMGRIVHVHMVGAWGKFMEILRGCDLPPAMVLHAYSGAPELIVELARVGVFFAFGTAVCDLHRARLRVSVAAAPVSRILAESDNVSPDTIPETVNEIARIRGENSEKMAEIIYDNTKRLINDGKI